MGKRQRTPTPGEPAASTGKGRNKRFSLNRWGLLGLLVLSAALIVFFVSNVIAVNKLVDDIDARRGELEELERQNERLKAELVRLQSPDRVTAFARENLGMIQAPQAPNRLR